MHTCNLETVGTQHITHAAPPHEYLEYYLPRRLEPDCCSTIAEKIGFGEDYNVGAISKENPFCVTNLGVCGLSLRAALLLHAGIADVKPVFASLLLGVLLPGVA